MRYLLVILLVCGVSHAGALSTMVSGGISAEISTNSFSTLAACSQSGASSAACTDNEALASLNLQAAADYGSLSGQALGIITDSVDLTHPNFGANASFTDSLTIDAAGLSSGFVQYTYFATGQASPAKQNGFVVQVDQNGALISLYLPYALGDFNPAQTTVMAPFTSGVPFSFEISADVSTFPEAFAVNPTSDLDQFQVTLTGISVFDGSGQLVTNGVTVYSDSSAYGGLVTETPEPSTVALVPLILAGLILAGRMRTGWIRTTTLPAR